MINNHSAMNPAPVRDLKCFGLRRRAADHTLNGALTGIGWLIVTGLALFYLLALVPARAEPYITAGMGQSKTCHTGQDGCWYQSRWKYQIDEHSNAWHIGLGTTNFWGLSWLSGEIRYHNLGEYNIFAGFTPSDENYNPYSHNGCHGDCLRTVYGYGHADIKAVSFSLLPEYRFENVSLYARLGIARIKAKYEVLFSDNENPYAKEMKSFKPPHYMLWEPQYGIGLRWRDFSVEYTETSPMKPEDSCIAKSRAVTLNYRWWFGKVS